MKKILKNVVAYLLVFVFIFSLNITDVQAAATNDTCIYFLGDSRTVGMESYIKKADYRMSAKVGAGYNYLFETASKELKNTIQNCEEKTKWVIVASFGVNDLADINVYMNYYRKLLSELPSGKTYSLYITPVFQVDSSKKKFKSSVTNEQINEFNKKMKEINDPSHNIYYLDSLDNTLNQAKIKSYLGEDGLHYSSTGYREIYKMIIPKVLGSDEFATLLKDFLDRDVTDEDVYNYSLIISSLKADGLTDNAIAGMLGNIRHEGAAGTYAIEGMSGKKIASSGITFKDFVLGNTYNYGDTKPALYTNKKGRTIGGEGHGLVQWSFGRCDNLTKFAEEHPDFGFVTVTHWKKSYDTAFHKHTCKIPSLAGQVCFMIQEINTGYKACKEHINNASTPAEAAKLFHDEYEKSANINLGARQNSAEKAIALINNCTGVITDGKSNTTEANQQQALADALSENGIWKESQFTSFCNLTETELKYPSALDLDVDELHGTRSWTTSVKLRTENAVISFLRKVFIVFAILLIIWVIFVYLAYWFDRINTVFEFSLLSILTFGKLLVAPDEDSVTFEPRGKKTGEPQTVNHRAILTVCLTAIFFAVLILTGQIYVILAKFVYVIRHALGI